MGSDRGIEKLSKRRSKFGRNRVWLTATVAGLVIVGSGGCGESAERVDPAEAQVQTDSPIKVPSLSKAEQAEALKVATSDPAIESLFAQGEPQARAVGVWTRPNQELLGAAVEFEFATPQDFSSVELPTILNTEDLYGNLEEGNPGTVDPNISPEIGLETYTASDVRGFSAMVSLKDHRVDEVILRGHVEAND